MLPIDKIIGKIYPFFGAVLLFSAFAIGFRLVQTGAPIPELSLSNMHPDNAPIFPLLFFTITCGALSGFHATQSPIISRTTQRESNGRMIFYGMMIAEGIIAMIWAAAAMSLFDGYGLAAGEAALVVSEASTLLLGSALGTIAVLGVIVLPITSGDTAFRSARMVVADYLSFTQGELWKRFAIAVPMFVISFVLTQIDFTILWRYFSWANQMTAVIALWVGVMYLLLAKKNHWVATVPAVFMTFNVITYILYAQIGLGLELNIAYAGGVAGTIIWMIYFYRVYKKTVGQEGFLIDYQIPAKTEA